ncbi:MAG: HPP family protein [Methylococcaceae bacterium]
MAIALTAIMVGDPVNSLGFSFVLMPVGATVAILLLTAIVINRCLLHLDYSTVPHQHPDDNTFIETA